MEGIPPSAVQFGLAGTLELHCPEFTALIVHHIRLFFKAKSMHCSTFQCSQACTAHTLVFSRHYKNIGGIAQFLCE